LRLTPAPATPRTYTLSLHDALPISLTAERTLLQVALADPDATAQTLRSACEQVLALEDHQERLIDALLTLATSEGGIEQWEPFEDRKSTRLNSSHRTISYAVFCLKK